MFASLIVSFKFQSPIVRPLYSQKNANIANFSAFKLVEGLTGSWELHPQTSPANQWLQLVVTVIPVRCPDDRVVPGSGSWTGACGTYSLLVLARCCRERRRSRETGRPSAACVSASRCTVAAGCRRVGLACILEDTAPWGNCIPCTRERSAPASSSSSSSSNDDQQQQQQHSIKTERIFIASEHKQILCGILCVLNVDIWII